MYEHLVHVYKGVADRMPVPQDFWGWTDVGFLDLTWIPEEQYGELISNSRWLPGIVTMEPLERHFKYGSEVFEVDEDRKVVYVTHTIVPMTEQEAIDQDVLVIAQRKQQARQARQNREWQGYTYEGSLMPVDDSARLRLLELGAIAAQDPDFAGFYPSPSDPWFELDQASALALANSAASFMWACLQREHDIALAIEDWTFTDEMLSEGWPA